MSRADAGNGRPYQNNLTLCVGKVAESVITCDSRQSLLEVEHQHIGTVGCRAGRVDAYMDIRLDHRMNALSRHIGIATGGSLQPDGKQVGRYLQRAHDIHMSAEGDHAGYRSSYEKSGQAR